MCTTTSIVAFALLCSLSSVWAGSLDKERPVTKVVRILEDMKAQLEKEASEDDEVMEKMVCWCETNDKEKTIAISSNTAKITQLETAIEEYDAKAQQLDKEAAQLKKDVGGSKQELAEATAMRDKDRAEFVSDEKEQIVSIQGITNALSALNKKLALPQEALVQVRKALKGRKDGARSLKKLGMSSVQRSKVESFLQTTVKQEPASAEILGILKQMKDDFEASLKESRGEEKTAEKAYTELKAAKENEMKAASDQMDAKEAQAATATENLAQSKTDLKDTKATLEADTKFLADLKEKCANMDAEFAARKKVRLEEITAVSEALGVLTSDEARDQISKSIGFVQVSSVRSATVTATETESQARARKSATSVVLAAAMKSGNPRLSSLAIRMQSDVFDKVKKAIDELVVQLKKENKDEIKQKDWCVKELNENARSTDAAYHQQHKLQTQNDELDLLLKNGGDEIAADKAAVAEMQIQMKAASENREKENKVFVESVQDQRATQQILTLALDKLKGFYAKKGAALVQSAVHKSGKQPGGFKEYKKSGGAAGVMSMIAGIIAESKAVEQDAIAAEQDAQAAYEGFIKDTNKSIVALKKAIASKTEAVAKADGDMARVSADRLSNMETLESLHAVAAEIHGTCDYTLQNFDQRQASRATEIDAMNQAKAIMSGAR